ncbi:hypothetical protein JCM10908_006240 [Rhodotorula pacifica]|uniref:Mtm1p n=1 Tax=Rhodotorula pacifica TaxID=1495444 RepID=UPI00317A5B9C
MEIDNALSEELSILPAHPVQQPAPAAATETDKMLAACIGAVLTSLTMTPFDVIKTRLQTQPPRNSNNFTSLRNSNSPWPPPIPSTSKAVPVECCKAPNASDRGGGRGGGGAKYFNPSSSSSSASAELLCRFDPRIARASLPSAGSHTAVLKGGSGSSAAATARSALSGAAAAAGGAHQYLHHLAPVPGAGHAGAGAGAIACLYSATTSSHATVSLPYALSHSASFAPSSASSSVSLSSAPQHRYLTGFTDALLHIVRSEGITALWRGTAPALVMSVPGQVVYMVGYDSLRRRAFDRAPTWALANASEPRAGAGAGEGRPPLKASYVTAVPLLAGALSRTVVAVLLSPLELVRTQIQSHVPSSSSASAGLGPLLRELKWSNAWRGLTPTLWRDVPFSGVYWAGYEAIKRSLTGGRGMGETGTGTGVRVAATKGAEQSKANEFAIAFVSGAGSGMIAATLTNPFDVIKTRRQAVADSSPSSTSSASASASATSNNRTFTLLRTIIKQEGYAGLFAGLTPRLAKVGPACGLMIGCYEAISSFSATSRANSTNLTGVSSRRSSAAE